MLKYSQLIIILFVTSLLGSNLLWAGEGQFDTFLDSESLYPISVDNSVLHHVEDAHIEGHDCHMSAHLVGLNSPNLTFTDFKESDRLPALIINFSSRKSPPPNKPPRV